MTLCPSQTFTPSARNKQRCTNLEAPASATHLSNRQRAHYPTTILCAYMANRGMPDDLAQINTCCKKPSPKPSSSALCPSLCSAFHSTTDTHRHTASHPLIEEAGRAGLQQAHICVAWPERPYRTAVVYIAVHAPKHANHAVVKFKCYLATLHLPIAVLPGGTASVSAADDVRCFRTADKSP